MEEARAVCELWRFKGQAVQIRWPNPDRVAGAPLDKNICERALEKAILHRKNAPFFKTTNGARVGDAFMSLIYTCELCGVNPFDYLTELERHADELGANPRQWMPWDYQESLANSGASRSPT